MSEAPVRRGRDTEVGSGASEGTSGSTDEWRAIGLIARREIVEAARRKAVWFTAGLFLIGSIALVVLPDLLGGTSGPVSRSVAVTDGVSPTVLELLDELAVAVQVELEVERASHVDEELVERVRSGELDAIVRFDSEPPRVLVVDADDQLLLALVREAVQSASVADELTAVGLDEAMIATALSPTVPQIEVLDTERGGRQLVALVAALVTYLVLLLLAMQIATGVAIEKSSRVSEVLLAIVPVRALLFGKVVGLGLIGLSILAIGTAPVAIRFALGASMPPGAGSTLLTAGVFSVLGVLLYLCLAGALGALVERSEDVNSTVGPLTAVLILGYFVGQAASDTPVGLVLALAPVTSPMVMPARVALGEAGAVQVAVALVLLAGGLIVAARVATVIYGRAIVRTGTKLRLRDLRAHQH